MSVRLRRSRFSGLSLLTFILCLSIAAIFFVYHSAKPALVEYASAVLYQTTYKAATDIIEETLQGQTELVTIERDEHGEIVALNTDAWRLNSIKTQTVSNLIRDLRSEHNREIAIPLGSITGSLFLSVRGPKIHLSVLPVTTIEAEYRNEFFDAGINQTLHKLMMHLTIHTGFLYSSNVVSKTVEIDLCLSETVVIGKTPQFFAGID